MNFIPQTVTANNQSLSVYFIRVYGFKQQEKSSPQYTLQGTTNGKNGTKKLSNLNEVDEMVIFIVGADGGEEI